MTLRSPLIQLAFQSLRNRWTTALLVSGTIAVSVALLLGVLMIRRAGEESFASALSGTDLVVGARTGDINLLLIAVFRIGDATADVSWDTCRKIAAHRDVAWTVPISLGDSHKGFRVLGTTGDYFVRYHYNDGRSLAFAAGRAFQDTYDAVVGADVAEQLHYRPGTTITLAHGTGEVSFMEHAAKPFRITGVLARTGTPVDRTVHVSLDAITALHADTGRDAGRVAPEPDGVTALLVGLRSRAMTLTMQRAINTYRGEALTAILPRVALDQLWKVIGTADRLLLIVSGFVVAAGMLGLMTSILAGLNERRREMAILRALGARPAQIFGLLVAEAGLLALAGLLLGTALCFLLLVVARPLLRARFGIDIPLHVLGRTEWLILAVIGAAGLLAGIAPAWRACANSLHDGLQQRT